MMPKQSMTVLIVDADWEAAQYLAALLRASCVVGLATTASDAILLIRQRIPDMIVTELNLPDSNGIDFIQYIHRIPETYNVLLMVVTNRASVQDKIAAFTAGADDYLVKPVAWAQLQLHLQLLSRFRQVIRLAP
jgi:DNA-binding response OmpR family regulator